MRQPSPEYAARKAAFDRCLTVHGRNPVLEALQCPGVRCERLHLACSNRPAAILEQIEALARSQGAEVRLHDREALARISRHAREDQGVAADVRWPGYRQLADLVGAEPAPESAVLAADGLTNPQNLGMLIRSATAAGCAGILLPRGCDIGPLVIKASAGTVFRAPLVRCDALPAALSTLRERGWRVAVLDARAGTSLFAPLCPAPRVYVLGGETRGVSAASAALADERLHVPIANGVESLNVAVTAALVAYRAAYRTLNG
jgi:23S rRNA (guanosine2251-2'-O)-methyltransferase